MPKNMLFSAVLRGVTAGLISASVSSLAAAVMLMFTPDPLQLVFAAALGCCFIMGFFASVFAGKHKKEKPLWASLLSGLVLCIVLFAVSLVGKEGVAGFVKCGVLMLGVLTGLLAVPAASRKKSRYRKLVRNQ